jgi:glycosyltransferase involved in cell wall biosynthesis
MVKQVGIEGSLFFKRSTGVGLYAKNLTRAASKIESDVNFEIVRHWLPFKHFTAPLPANNHLSYRLVKWFPPMVYYQVFKRLDWFLPYDLIAMKHYDSILFFNFIAYPVRKKTKSIIVVHDLSFIYFPQFAQAKNLKYTTKLMKRSIKRASHIITISENSKKEIMDYYKIDNSNISIVPNGIDHQVFYPRTTSEISKAAKKYKLPKEYIYFHGTIEPRKNIDGILDAYSSLAQTVRDKYGLVISGGKGWNDEAIYKKIEHLKAKGYDIVLPGYIDGPDLPAVYSGASIFVFPSFYEGFGVPPLEAMACGVPVISSNNSSLPEVVGDAALQIEASDISAIAKSIERILTDSSLATTLRKKGFVNAKKFSWDNSAKKLLSVLEGL